jgi:hypothetical protein
MKLDDLRCFDCALYRASFDCDCIKHTPIHLRGARELRIHEVIAPAVRQMAARGRA